MKKRILSALLVLCMACSMVSTVWATETNATSGAPEPASQTLNLDNEQPGGESGADSTSASSDSTDSTSASSDSTSSGSSSAASDAASDVISGEGDESAASSDSTAASDSTPSSSSASSDSSDSDADDPDAAGSDVTGDESGTGAGEESGPVDEQPGASSEPVPSQPNRAPAAAAPALPAETRATANTFHIIWDNYFDVTVHYVDQNGLSIEHGFDCQNRTLNNGGSLTFSNFATESTFETDTGTYTYEGAHYGSYNGDNVTSVSASQNYNDYLLYRYYSYYYNFDNKRDWRLTYNAGGINQTHSTQTASIYLVYNYEEFQPEELPEDDAISIVETVAQDGMFTAVYNGKLEEGDTVTYTWEVSRNGVAGTWTPVESQKVTGENFNWQPDVDPEKINVAYDALLRNVSDDQRYFYRVTATVTRADESTEEHQAQLQVPYYIQLQNGSFENPDIPGDQFNEQWPNGQPGLIWQTTGPGSINGRDGDDIEVILENRNGTQQNYGVNQAADGEQFAELNCEAYGALYQDVMTVPGTTLNWSFAHLARDLDEKSDYAQDTMAMVIMPADQADEIAEALQEAADSDNPADRIGAILNGLEGKTGCYVYTVTDSTWNRHHDWPVHSSQDAGAQPYTVPDDQYLTRFFFVSVDADYDHRQGATHFGTVGNLIDDVWFSTKVPEPDDDEAQLTVQKTVAGLDDLSDYSVTMTVQPEDEGEQARTITFDSSKFTANTDGTYTATATITYKVAANTGSKTVTVSESGYEVSGYEVSSTYDVTGAATASGTGTQVSNITIPARQNATVTFTNTYTPTIPKTATLTLEKTFVGLTDEDVYFLLFDQTKSDNPKDRREANFSFDVNFCDTKEDGFKEGSGWMENLQKQDNNDSPYKNETYYRPGTEEKITNGGEFIVYSVDCLTDVGLDKFKEENYSEDTRKDGIGAYLRKENGNWVYTQTLTVPTCTDSGNRYFYTVFEQHAELPGYSKLDTSSVSYTVSLNNGEKMWNGIGKFICDEGKSIVSMDGITEQECIYGKTEKDDEITPFARLYITGDTTIEFKNNYLDSMEVTKNVTLDGTAITSANEELNKEYTITLSPADTTKLVSTSSNSNKKGQGPDWNTKMTGYTVTATYSGGLRQHNETTLTFNNDGTLDIPLYPGETVTLGNLPSISYQLTESETVTVDTDSYYFDGKSFAETYNDDKVSSDAAQWNSYNTGEDVGKSDTQDGKVALDVSLTDHDESVAVTLTNQYKTYKQLTIKKVTTGAMGADDDWFDFEVTGENNAEYTLTDNQEPTNSDYDFKLNNGSTVVLTKLKDGDVVTIRENGAVNGYTFQGADAEATSEGGFELTPKNGDGNSGDYTVNSANNAVTVTIPDNAEADLGIMTFTNARQAVAPTGLESNHTTPYVLMITAAGMAGLALIGGIVARRRRRRME